jgi:hypothetical protein
MDSRLRVNGKITRSHSRITLGIFNSVRLIGFARIRDVLALIRGEIAYVPIVIYDDRPNFWEPRTEQVTLEMKIADPERLSLPMETTP